MSKWIPELQESFQCVPIVLIATKVELREDNDELFVSKKEGEILSQKIKANAFIECSAKLNMNVKEAIEAAVIASENGLADEQGYFSKICCYFQQNKKG